MSGAQTTRPPAATGGQEQAVSPDQPLSYPNSRGSDTRPLPPYGREFLRRCAMDRRLLLNLRVYVGKTAWRRAKDRNTPITGEPEGRTGGWGLVLPVGTHPSDYRWPVAGVDVLVMDDGGDRGGWTAGQELALYLVERAGASAVWWLPNNFDLKPMRFHRAPSGEEAA